MTAKTLTREQYQVKLEEMFSKYQLFPRVREYFKNHKQIPFGTAILKARLPVEFAFDMLAQIAVHKRADLPTMVGCLRRHCETAQEVADLLDRAVNFNFLEYSNNQFIVIYEISSELQSELDLYQYPLPMVTKPLELNNNLSTGYLTQKGSVILRDNHHDEDVNLKHLNTMNSIQLSVDTEVATRVQNSWSGTDKQKSEESYDDFKKRRRAFQKYCQVAETVIRIMVLAGNKFHLTHAYDKRGRTYCRGHHISYQGNDWNKAVLRLSKEEVIEGA